MWYEALLLADTESTAMVFSLASTFLVSAAILYSVRWGIHGAESLVFGQGTRLCLCEA